MCDNCLRDIPKKFLRALLSWHLVSSRLKNTSIRAKDIFLHMRVTFCVTYPKHFLESLFHGTPTDPLYYHSCTYCTQCR